MINRAPNLDPRRCPVHPGAVLREDMLPASGKTKVEIARLLGISRQHLHDIMEEKKPLSPKVAVRVGKLFGGGAGIWVRMQAAHDTWHAEQTVDVSNIPTLKVA
ncbi:HigA family addiction module antidote protein [Bradyrhizobium arachidis]|uniref:HigA family addiction module antitoxin n=1 Tax=Bradyrhizobium TaxID=374 RepID=UPI00188AFC28|nr:MULTISPECIES: HigA family addiction module antitoxin [Bradyrhizobium]MDN4986930.1 HigA family addiction module antitoxin [Bradyrhizobium sp. WYCCWR 13022]QOZ50717.1 addiction module antidote protein, HigA family [Bradyrhizobium sp. CCBAU 53338]UVO40329.1 HigA family addiction module antidote protein [Bradyrhizobium arachidis]